MEAIIFSSTVCSRENRNIYIYTFFLWDVKELTFWIKGNTNIEYNHTIIVGRAITKWEAKEKRSIEPIYKTHTKIQAKILRVTTFAIVKLEERLLNGEQWKKVQYWYRNIGKINIFKG